MKLLARARLYARVARAEGARSALARAAERAGQWRRRRAYRFVGVDAWRDATRGVRVLNLLPTQPSERLGGVQVQFLRRLEAEARLRPCAWLHPERDGWRLESPAARVTLGLETDAPGGAWRDARFEDAVRRALDLTSAELLHVENLAGLPLESLARLAEGGLPLVASLHDFALFCPRPLLLERPAGRFCGYVRDTTRCGACLASDRAGDRQAIEARRAAGARLLGAARALVFPSEFLRAKLAELLPVPAGVAQVVVPPSSGAARAPSRARAGGRHAAFVGTARPEKGVGVFEQVVERLRGGGVRFSAYGGGEPEALLRLRASGVRVRGYYRAGSLPARLASERVDAALLLSVGPESYGLTLDECVAAGVPAIVFDVGAAAERVRAWNAGRVVPLASGADGVAAALDELLTSGGVATPVEPAVATPTPESAARAHVALYERLP